MTKEERLRLISAMYETGLPVRSMCVSTLTKYSLGNDNHLKEAARIAEKAGVQVT